MFCGIAGLDRDKRVNTGLLGARSMVGECVIPLLREDGRQVFAFSRSAEPGRTRAGVTWLQLPSAVSVYAEASRITDWVCVAPIWVLPQYLTMLETYGVRRIVALSSTSLFVKNDSSDRGEQETARRLADGECAVRAWAEAHSVQWVILRPTLIYGHGQDKNLTEILRFVRRYGFFPLLGQASGLRQPVYVQDVATACVSALTKPPEANRPYNLSGGETLSYRDMVCRVFTTLGKLPRLVTVPRWLFRLAVTLLRLLPQYKHWTMEMAERMNRDLVFDHVDATRDLGFSPRPFRLLPEDIPT